MWVHPVVDYRFACGANGKARISTSHSMLGDLRGLDSVHCNPLDNGITSGAMLESNLTIKTMRQAFLRSNATGLATEIWIKPGATIESRFASFSPIMTIATDQYRDDDDFFECQNMALTIGLRGNLLEIRYVDNDPYESCRVLLVRQRPLNNGEMSQIVLTLNQRQTSVYINGELIIDGARNNFKTNLAMWNPYSTLQLLSNHQSTQGHVYSGVLYQVSIYDQVGTFEQVQQSYKERLQEWKDGIVNREPLHLVASAEVVTVIQGQSSSFSVGGFNQSMPEYEMWVEILDLPSHGTMLSEKGPIRDTGTRILLQGSSNQVSLFYRPLSNEFFTSPKTTFGGKELNVVPDSVKFRLVATGVNDGKILGWSEAVQKDINIQHVNRPPTLEVPRTAVIPEDQSSSFGGYPIAYIQDALLEDPDMNVDRVRVDIWATNGTLALLDYAALADFAPRRHRNDPSWQCHGDPNGSRNMTFLAEPDSVTQLLSSLQYEGFFWDQGDIIVIRIYDGSGGACLDEDEHSRGTIFDGCYEIVAEIKVPPISKVEKDFKLSDVSFLEISFWLLLLVPLMACGCLFQCLFKCLRSCRKGSGVEVDGTCSDSIVDEISVEDDEADTEEGVCNG